MNGSFTGNANLTTSFIGDEQIIGNTSAATLLLGNVGSAPVFVFIKNMDATNYITVDAVSALNAFPQKILPGNGVYLTPLTGTIYAQANTAPCKAFVVSAG